MSPKQENNKGFTAEEKAAMQQRTKELKAEARSNQKREDGLKDVLEKISEISEPEHSLAVRLHEIITENAPELWPKTWYGMPAYAREGKVIVFFQSAEKFKTRYLTLGFSDSANLDEGVMWPVSFAIKDLTAEEEEKISGLVKKAAS